MSDMAAACKKMGEFFEKELGREKTQLRFVKITKTPEGWNGKVEVTEENSHLTKLDRPSIFEKNIYIVDMDDALNVTNFCQEGADEGF